MGEEQLLGSLPALVLVQFEIDTHQTVASCETMLLVVLLLVVPMNKIDISMIYLNDCMKRKLLSL